MNKEYLNDIAEVERRLCRRSVYYLARNVLSAQVEKSGGKNLMGPQHAELAKDLQNLWKTRHQRDKTWVKVEQPRGVLKSTLCTVGYAIWVLLQDANARILIDSAVVGNSKGFLKQIREFFESSYCHALFGKLYDSKSGWNMDNITIIRDGVYPQPSVDTGGLEAVKVSQHYDLIISDDLQNKDNCKTREQREKVKEHARLYRQLLNKGGMCLFVGTRWDFDDLFALIDEWIEMERKRLLPRTVFNFHKSSYKYLKDARGVDTDELSKELQFPEILSESELQMIKARDGLWLYSCNMLVRPQSDETAMVQKAWIQYHQLKEGDWDGWNVYATVDPSYEGTGASADDNAIVAFAISPDWDLYVLETWNKKGSRLALCEKLYELDEKYSFKAIGVEAIFHNAQLLPYLKQQFALKGRMLKFEQLKDGNKTKKQRIEGFVPFVEGGHVFLRPTQDELENQMIRYDGGESTATKKDDLFDALAYAHRFMRVPKAVQEAEYWKKAGWRQEIAALVIDEGKIPSESDIRVWQWQERRAKMARRKRSVQRTRGVKRFIR